MTTPATKLVALLALVALPLTGSAADATVRFLEARVQADPLDFVAHNQLAGAYIKTMRETGDLAFLDRAAAAARASLAAVPASRNPDGLTARALVEFESHHFAEALQLAQQAGPPARAIAGDAHLELGNYAEAETIFRQLDDQPATRARLSRLAEIHGDNTQALALLTGDEAWYCLRRGAIYFRTGRFSEAEKEYRRAPESFHTLDHLAELRAAQGRYAEALALYQKLPARPEILQAIGDIYHFQNQPAAAKTWHDRALAGYLKSVAQGNAHYYHHLASFYCDAQENPGEALKWARRDIEVRQSVYAYDTLAWALYKAGDFPAAVAAMKQALTHGTQDAHLLQHAGLIFSRAGNLVEGRHYLRQATALNPSLNTFHAHR